MFKKVKLKNGLTLILNQNKKSYHTTVSISVLVGGHDVNFKIDGKEKHFNYGIAHVLEHYLIEQSIYGNIMKIFNNEFVKANGSTSPLETCYYFSTVHHFKRDLIKLLNVVNNPDFSEDKLALVKNPIIQEIRMYADGTGKLFDDTLMKNTFKTKVVDINSGTEEDVEKISVGDLKLFHEAFYRPQNEIITIDGNFPDNIVEIIENEYQKFHFKDYKVQKEKIVEPKEVMSEFEMVHDKSIPESLFQINYKIDLSKFTPLERNKIDYYIDYLYYNNFSRKSELSNKLISDKLLVHPILDLFNPTIVKNTLLFGLKVYAENYDKIIEIIKDRMNHLASDPISFARWKNGEIIFKINDLEHIDYKANNFISNLILYDLEQVDSLEFVQSFSLEEYLDLIGRIDFSNYSVVVNDVDK